MTESSRPMEQLDNQWTEKEVIYFSRLKPISTENGGFRRVAQVVAALEGLDCSVVSAVDYYGTFNSTSVHRVSNVLGSLNSYLEKQAVKVMCGIDTSHVYEKWAEASRDNYYKLFHLSRVWRDMLEMSSRKLKLAIVDDPVYFSPLIEYLVEHKVPIIAHCHNIESLSRSQVVSRSQSELLKHELNLLRRCNVAITISHEENFLLNNMGISSWYFPYYPVESIRLRMESIREKRTSTVKRDYLLLGTVLNPPTLDGMIKVLEKWHPAGESSDDRLVVAGYGTARLADKCSGRNDIVFMGEIGNNELDNILCACKGTIIYQEHGSGALTKICEYLLAGIPVLVNSHAARSYHYLPGVVEFESLNHLLDGMYRADMSIADICIPEPPHALPLMERIASLRNQNLEMTQ